MTDSNIILGAGLTGIGCARHLPDSVIYEAREHPGGHVYSHSQGGYHFDEGAHICHATDPDWLDQLYRNAGDVVNMKQSRVGYYWHGHWGTYPVQNHLRDLPVELRIQALKEIVHAHVDRDEAIPASYADWCRSQYGELLTERFYREYTEKYWRMDMEDMDVDWLSGRLLPSQLDRILHGAIAPMEEKQSVFATFHYPARGGFFAFFEPFYRDVDIRQGKRMVSVDPAGRKVTFADGESAGYRNLISTIPLNDLVRAMPDSPDAIRKDAESLRHTQMIGVNLVVRKPALTPYHWFYVYDRDIDVSRVKVLSNVIPDSMNGHVTILQTEIFRRDDEAYDVERLKAKAVSDLSELLSFDPETDLQSVDHVIASHAYTIPTLGRQASVDRIHGWLADQGIYSAGLYGRWKYIWSNQAYEDGKKTALALKGE